MDGCDESMHIALDVEDVHRVSACHPYAIDGLDTDSDDDGLTDAAESGLGTDPLDTDSDNDGLSDGEEVVNRNTDGDEDRRGTVPGPYGRRARIESARLIPSS
jgi:hypothetical protein